MKVLYISHCQEQSGWGHSCRQLMKAITSAGIDVVSRPVLLNNSTYNDEFLEELKNKSSQGCDICVQQVLPNFFCYNGNFRNIGYILLDSLNINNSPWVDKINLMDEIWVPNTQTILIDNGIKVPQKLVPLPCDLDEYKEYTPLELEPGYKFYFIGEFIRRKNIGTLIKAFHSEFELHEPVQLILKCNKMGFNSTQLFNEMKNFCEQIQKGLKLRKEYKSELVITDNMSREDLLRLHSTCNCFVNTSYGEAWQLSCMDAMGIGNRVISTNEGGPRDYLKEYPLADLVEGEVERVFGATDTVQEVFAGRENWTSINFNALCKTMRNIYELDKRPIKSNQGKRIAYEYSYNKIGTLIKKILENN